MSPITTWLKGGTDRGMHAIYFEGKICVSLIGGAGIAGMGEGDTVEEAEAAALNDAMVRRETP